MIVLKVIAALFASGTFALMLFELVTTKGMTAEGVPLNRGQAVIVVGAYAIIWLVCVDAAWRAFL